MEDQESKIVAPRPKKKSRKKKDFALKINMPFDGVLKIMAAGTGSKKPKQIKK